MSVLVHYYTTGLLHYSVGFLLKSTLVLELKHYALYILEDNSNRGSRLPIVVLDCVD